MQNKNNLMFQVIFIFSWLNFDKASHSFFQPSCLWGNETDFQKIPAEVLSGELGH